MSAAEENRRRMPTVAKFIDEARAVFGPGIKILYAKENGYELGKRPDPQSYVTPDVTPMPPKTKRK